MRAVERTVMIVTFLAAAAILAGALADVTEHVVVGVPPDTTFRIDWCDGSTVAVSDTVRKSAAGILWFQTEGDPGPCWASFQPAGKVIAGGSCDWQDRRE